MAYNIYEHFVCFGQVEEASLYMILYHLLYYFLDFYGRTFNIGLH